LEGEIGVCGGKYTDEVCFKSLNGLISRVDAVVMRLNEHIVAPFDGEIFFDDHISLGCPSRLI
jgi:hypothetical protein